MKSFSKSVKNLKEWVNGLVHFASDLLGWQVGELNQYGLAD